MRKFIIPVFAAALMMYAGITCYAGGNIRTSQEEGSDKVSISIESDNKVKSLPVMVRIMNSAGEYNFIELGYTDENGVLELTYINDKDLGMHTVYANIDGEIITGSYIKMGSAEYGEFVNAVNAQQNSASPNGAPIKAVFDKYAEYVNIDTARHFSLKNPDRVYQLMAEDTSFKGSINSFNDVKKAYYAAIVLEGYNEDKESLYALAAEEPYKSIIAEFAPVLEKSGAAAKPNVKKAVTEALGSSYNNIKQLVSDAELLILRKSISSATHWNDVKTALIQYKDILGIDPKKANNDVFKSMMGKDYPSYSSVAGAFTSLLSSNSSNKGSGGGGGGGSSGGSGGGGGMVMHGGTGNNPQPTEQPVNSTPEPEVLKGKAPFEDLEDAKWAVEAITYAYERGIVSGVDDTRFEPNRFISRAEAVKLLMAMINAEPEPVILPFADVTEDDWYYSYVGAAYRRGIVNGRSDTEFDAISTVTREEMAVMTYRTMQTMMGQIAPPTTEVTFNDRDEIDDWAYDAVSCLYSKNIMVGRNGQMFDPKDNITRAEAAMVIFNVLKSASAQ